MDILLQNLGKMDLAAPLSLAEGEQLAAEITSLAQLNVYPRSIVAIANLLDDFHAREVLHVTYGSVINRPDFRSAFFDTLTRHEEDYGQAIEEHFDRHLQALNRG